MKFLNKFRGCLLGGAAGDALGYAVEFLDRQTILHRYGNDGITEYDLVDSTALISDDTQMTLFTATAIASCRTHKKDCNETADYITASIETSYRDWLRTQNEHYPIPEPHDSWLLDVPELFHSRTPGITCLSALSASKCGTMDRPINESKGCGGIMRVAPIGLCFDDPECAAQIAARAAALTHGHELGYLPAAMFADIICRISHSRKATLMEAVSDARTAICRQFPNAAHMQELLTLYDRAVALSCSKIDDAEAIRSLGEGWVAEETLAIAVYCALKYAPDFDRALITAVNHDGDSDSTGAVTGNLLGAYLGLEKIPQKYQEKLELREVILRAADDLYAAN